MTNPTPHWIETSWLLPKSSVENLSVQLEQMGCLGNFEKMALTAEEEQRRAESEFIAYFPDAPDPETVRKRLSPLARDGAKLVSVTRIPQQDWATEWKKYFKPFELTPGIVIKPSWEAYSPRPGEKVVTLDPGMAFGTGQHDTTRFCAELLCEIKRTDPGLKTFLDVGCGSGILSLIARKVGYESATGLDVDPAAIETADENLERNPDLHPTRFMLTRGGLSSLDLTPHDVVAANIIAETLCELKDELVALVKPGGYLIVSGILPERGAMVREAFGAPPLALASEKTSPDWHAYVYRRQ